MSHFRSLVHVVLVHTLNLPVSGEEVPGDDSDSIREIFRVERDFYRTRYDDLTHYISWALGAGGLLFSVLAFLGLKGIADAKRQLVESKEEIDGLKREAQDHLEEIAAIRKQSADWTQDDIAAATDEISSLAEQLAALQHQFAVANPEAAATSREDKDVDVGVDLGSALPRMLEALKTGPYRWRSLDRLAVIGGIEVDEARKILHSLADEVVFSVGKSGRTIVRHKFREG